MYYGARAHNLKDIDAEILQQSDSYYRIERKW